MAARVTPAQARRIALAAQGFCAPRPAGPAAAAGTRATAVDGAAARGSGSGSGSRSRSRPAARTRQLTVAVCSPNARP